MDICTAKERRESAADPASVHNYHDYLERNVASNIAVRFVCLPANKSTASLSIGIFRLNSSLSTSGPPHASRYSIAKAVLLPVQINLTASYGYSLKAASFSTLRRPYSTERHTGILNSRYDIRVPQTGLRVQAFHLGIVH